MLQSAPKRETTKPDPSRFALAVQPLLTTVWGQREPFKFMCPFDKYVQDFSLYGTYTPIQATTRWAAVHWRWHST